MTMLPTATPLFSTRRKRPRSEEDPAAGRGSGGHAIEASSGTLGFQLGDMLSEDPVQFLDRQRQPYGE